MKLMPGDIVLVDAIPPHIASVTGGGRVVCEDGSLLPISGNMSLLYSALDIIKELEKGVLAQNATR